jgi:hypothetical protein
MRFIGWRGSKLLAVRMSLDIRAGHGSLISNKEYRIMIGSGSQASLVIENCRQAGVLSLKFQKFVPIHR